MAAALIVTVPFPDDSNAVAQAFDDLDTECQALEEVDSSLEVTWLATPRSDTHSMTLIIRASNSYAAQVARDSLSTSHPDAEFAIFRVLDPRDPPDKHNIW